jgi:hypothetical protein
LTHFWTIVMQLSCTVAEIGLHYKRFSLLNLSQYSVWLHAGRPGVKLGRGVTLTTHSHVGPRSRMSRGYVSSSLCAYMAVVGQLYLNHDEATTSTQDRSVSQSAPVGSSLARKFCDRCTSCTALLRWIWITYTTTTRRWNCISQAFLYIHVFNKVISIYRMKRNSRTCFLLRDSLLKTQVEMLYMSYDIQF